MTEWRTACSRLIVDDAVAARFGDYAAVVVYAGRLTNGPSDDTSIALLDAATDAARDALAGRTVAELPHVAAWRDAFRAFGAKPSRFPSSVEALLKRVARGDRPPSINRLVDAYNATSLRYGLPAGGEDLERLVGQGRLTFADGSERFVVLGGEAELTEHPQPGEVVWADERGVTCRRWSWRQCRRTQLTEASTAAYFVLERLAPYELDELQRAADALERTLRGMFPGAVVQQERIGPGW